MATRIKTIEFGTTTVITTLATATVRGITGATQVYIPETGITFVSCILFVDCSGDNAAAASLTAPTVQFKLGTAAYSSQNLGNPNANSGENESWIFARDVTSYFTTNWTGTAMPWYILFSFTGLATCNHAAKLVITYTYDDTSSPNAHIKTIRIPIESTRSLLTTTFQTVGGATAIPNIGLTTSGYLPETGITIRDVFLELFANCGQNSATATFTIQTRFGGANTPIDTWRVSAVGLNSAVWAHSLIDITGSAFLTGNTSMEMVSLTTTSRGVLYGGWITVTYEFNPSTSTTIYNSLLLGAADTEGFMGATTAANQGSWQRTIYIEEPGTITQKESAVIMCFNDSGGFTFNISCSGDTSGQSNRAYTVTAGALQCGMYSLVHRIDSGGQSGASGLGTLKRGQNLYMLKFYSGTADSGWNLSGMLILNYTSGKHADGYGAHAHSVYQHLIPPAQIVAGVGILTGSTIAPTVPESQYYLVGLVNYIGYSIAAGADINFTLNAEIKSTDPPRGELGGWERLYTGNGRTDNENATGWNFSAARTSFTRWPGDPDPNRLNFLTSRRYRLDTNPVAYSHVGMWYTYNSISYTVSGTCSGYAGDGSGIPVDIYRKARTGTFDDQILSLTTTAGGTFTGKWIDNLDTLYAAAREDSTHIGRSADMTAG